MPPIPKNSIHRTKGTKKTQLVRGYDKIEQLTLQEKAFAALQLLPTWNATLAYEAIFDPNREMLTEHKKLAYLKNTKTRGLLDAKNYMAEMLTHMVGDASYLPNKGETAVAETGRHTTDEVESMLSDGRYDKEAILYELNRMARESSDADEKMKIFKMIADLERMKNEVVKEDDSVVRYYLPITCSRCSLHRNAVLRGEIEEDE